MSGFARTRARRVEALTEHPCGSRFPGITGESEAMLRLKASILKAAAHGREKKAAASEPGISLATLCRRMGQLGLLPGKRGNPDGRTYTRVEGNARAA